MSSIGSNFNNNFVPLGEIAQDPLTAAMTSSVAKTIGDQDALNQIYANANIDQFIASNAERLSQQNRAAKLGASKEIVDERIYKHFFDVYQSGLSISGMWSQMES
jgi:hypothetical protein